MAEVPFLASNYAVFNYVSAQSAAKRLLLFAPPLRRNPNPDSPYTTNSFYMKAKTAYFRDHYIVPIDKIISAMQSNTHSQKFSSAYKSAQKQFDLDAQLV